MFLAQRHKDNFFFSRLLLLPRHLQLLQRPSVPAAWILIYFKSKESLDLTRQTVAKTAPKKKKKITAMYESLYSHHSLFPSPGSSVSPFQSSHYLVALPGLQVCLWGIEPAQATVWQ